MVSNDVGAGRFHETEAEAELTWPMRGKAEAEAKLGCSRLRRSRGRMFEAEARQSENDKSNLSYKQNSVATENASFLHKVGEY